MEPFEHFDLIDVDKEWMRGFRGYWLRVRGIVTAVGTPSTASTFLKYHDYVGWTAFALLILLGLCLGAFLLIYRREFTRQCRANTSLHELFHASRFEIWKLHNSTDESEFMARLEGFHNTLAERIAGFFRDSVGDSSINVAIRLAESVCGKDQYATRGRSSKMDPRRAEQTEPLGFDEGLARHLTENQRMGVTIIRDVDQALVKGIWKRTKNDSLPDMKTLMISPINGFAKNAQKVMLGVVYVTSRKNPFRASHTIPLKALADLLGFLYPSIMERSPLRVQGAN